METKKNEEKNTSVELVSSEVAQIQVTSQLMQKIEQEISEKQYLLHVLQKNGAEYVKSLAKKHNLIEADNYEFKEGVLSPVIEKKKEVDTTRNSGK